MVRRSFAILEGQTRDKSSFQGSRAVPKNEHSEFIRSAFVFTYSGTSSAQI